jgi:molybdopterin molybdotransferase
MDGYALRHADLATAQGAGLKLVGTSLAGHPFAGEVNTGECVRIMTGAVMPSGADTVVMQEVVSANGEQITIQGNLRAGENVRYAGEDIQCDAIARESGVLVEPSDLGLLASLGVAEVMVRRRPRVAFFSTGDELRSVGQVPEPGTIYDSNRYTLYGMLTRLGVDLLDMGVIPDERTATEEAFTHASQLADVIITSGGVSVGDADYVTETLDKLGKVAFWKLAMKPGRPLAVGTIGEANFFGLPGNPVSVMVTFYQFVLPALRKMMGQRHWHPLTVEMTCRDRLRKAVGRTEFQRGIIEQDSEGRLSVGTTGAQGSGILKSMADANCLIVLPAESDGTEAGSTVPVQPFYGLI